MKTKTKIKKIVIPVILFHVLSYLPFTLTGEYKTSNYGGQDWRTEWHPSFMFTLYRGNTGRSKSMPTMLGVLYWPYWFLDRTLWHPTKYMETIPEQLEKMQ